MFKQGDKVKLKRDIYRWTHQEQPRQNVLYAREGEVGEITELFVGESSAGMGRSARWNAKVLIEKQIKTFRLSSIENQGFGHYELNVTQCDRKDFFELTNLLRTSQSPFLREVGLEIESELMEIH